ncbi:hypothetical protein K466DRAFT_184200 [Polyporus arcularius HHB13444]|uniref:Uncharacterized protein n=1 Tax=Polyporus arcularius HHB13444 TaxID=1314778 RepID=A0A5C3P7B3_9APHY|nr:hypothetical protein K466DRAFT_184200 [Polyporus arcularius HHB13444]
MVETGRSGSHLLRRLQAHVCMHFGTLPRVLISREFTARRTGVTVYELCFFKFVAPFCFEGTDIQCYDAPTVLHGGSHLPRVASIVALTPIQRGVVHRKRWPTAPSWDPTPTILSAHRLSPIAGVLLLHRRPVTSAPVEDFRIYAIHLPKKTRFPSVSVPA